MQYRDCVNYIEEIPKFTSKTDLTHTRRLLGELGDPDRNFRILHVAGTNGKGSVCAYLQAMLSAGGFRTATFTSPHLVRTADRFCIDGVPMEGGEFAEIFLEIKGAVDRRLAQGDSHPTYFEFLFLMAMAWFAKKKPDFVVLETGLGGRLDATNVIEAPVLSVITAIGLDHTKFLGETIPQIAAEKAGIIKRGAPVCFDAANAEAKPVLLAAAQKMGCEAIALSADAAEITRIGGDGIDFTVSDGGVRIPLSIRQVADYQVRNASLAFLGLRAIRGLHGLSDAQLAEGLFRMDWPGRMEVLAEGVVVDGAHNLEGVEAFLATAPRLAGGGTSAVLFGAAADKPYPAMIRRIVEVLAPARVVTTEFAGGRAVPAETLQEEFRAAGAANVSAVADPEEAFAAGLANRGEGTLFCVGSLYLVGAFRTWFRERQGESI